MGIADKLQTIAENEQKVYRAGQLNVISNAESLKGILSGKIINAKDVSPVEHTVGVKVSSKNLIPFPYAVTSGESNGLTWTVNDDGGITLNGTRSGIIMLNLWLNNINLEDGVKYQLSLANAVDGINIYAYYKDADNGQHWASSSLTYNKEWKEFKVYLQTKENAVFDNVTVHPMLERGTVATVYTPYVADVTAVDVKTTGKNLFNVSAVGSSYYDASINGLKKSSNGRILYTSAPLKQCAEVKSGETYIMTATHSHPDAGGKFVWLKGSGRAWHWGKAVTLTQDDLDNSISFYKSSSDESPVANEEVTITEIQIESGSTATAYEPYIEPVIYTPNADGTVDGVLSIYPEMNICTDTDGVIIDCNYYKDIDKAFNELTTNIALSGGN